MTMGEKILSLRKARGWSQEELAEHVGVTRQAVSRWESGTAKPDADKIIAICELFGVSADYLLRDFAAGGADPTEPAQVPPPKQTTALGDAVRGWTLGQWIGAIMTCVFGGILALLYVLSVVFPCDTNGITGLFGFLYMYDLAILWHICVAGLVLGILKLICRNGIVSPFWEDIKTFFNWDG